MNKNINEYTLEELQAIDKMSDLISRQAAIDEVHANYDEILDFKSTGRTVADSIEDIINALPSAQPDWNEMIVMCDCCGHAIQVKRQ